MQPETFRPIHYLKGSETTVVPKRIAVLSCDYTIDRNNDSGSHGTLRFCSGAVGKRITDKPDGVEFVFCHSNKPENILSELKSYTEAKGSLWVVSQSLGRDLTLINFWHEIESGRFEWHHPVKGRNVNSGGPEGSDGYRNGFLVISDPPIIIVGWWEGRKVIMVDARNYGAKQMPDQVGCVIKSKALAGWFTGMCDWVERNDLGVMRYTTSAMAYEAWKHRFMPTKVCIHGNKPACDLERSAYFGGRTELFFKGRPKGRVFQLDVQGLFPFVMRNEEYPTKLISCCSMIRGGEAFTDADGAIARVRIDTNVGRYPVRDRLSKRVIYPTGCYVTTLCGQELTDAHTTGDMVHAGLFCSYRMANLFRDYVDFFWAMRQIAIDDGAEEGADLAKAFLVGLYGKFGQKTARWEDKPEIRSPVRWGHWWKHLDTGLEYDLFRSLGHNTQQLIEGGETRESFPAIAAYVTGYARRYMDKLRVIAGGKHVYLQVVDSLYVDDEGLEMLDKEGAIENGVLGKLRIVGESSDVEFHGPLDFVFGDREVLAGISLERERVKAGTYKVKEETRLTTLFSGDPKRGIRIYDVLKAVQRLDPPGKVGADGWIESPILEEE